MTLIEAYTRLRTLFKKAEPDTPRDSAQGLSPEALAIGSFLMEPDPSPDRLTLLREMEEIDDTMPEGSRAIDVLADNAVNAEHGTGVSFEIRFDEGPAVSPAKQKIITDLIERTDLQNQVYAIARDALKYGDCFEQVCLDKNHLIVRLMYMDPKSMRRNEDDQGNLKTGTLKNEAAYEQYEIGSTRRVAWFYPNQIVHLRWNHSRGQKYGRPSLRSARYPYKKLRAMEEALVINWLTRAFARLVFKLDTTGLSDKEAKGKLETFKSSLSRRDVAVGVQGFERLTVAKDIVMGAKRVLRGGKWEESLDDVSILDTSNTGFWNITAVEYWRNKFITATGVPKAHLGLEKEINAKATLQWQDQRFARMVRRVQMVMSGFIRELIDLQLSLIGIGDVPYVISWPEPSVIDDREKAEMYRAYAQATDVLLKNQIASPEWIASHFFKMTPAQIKASETWFKAHPPKIEEPAGGSKSDNAKS